MAAGRAATLLGGCIGIGAMLAAIVVFYRHDMEIPPAGRAASPRAESAVERAPAQITAQRAQQRSEGGSPEAARASAQSALQQCLRQTEAAYHTKWNGMCAYVAERAAAEFLNCKQRGFADEYCRSLHESTPARDCLLPHAMASAIEQAGESAASQCYRRFDLAVQSPSAFSPP